MNEFKQSFDVRWADLDANNHMRHTAYNDYAAHVRISALTHLGLTPDKLRAAKMGPVLFDERINYHRELRPGDRFTVDVEVLASSPDHRKWKMKHNIYKSDDSLSAEIFVSGAWLDLVERKVKALPEELQNMLSKMPKAENHETL